MQINLNTTESKFPILSPILEQTPMFSPLPEDTLRKYSYNYDQLVNFRLEVDEDECSLLSNINQIPAQYPQSENKQEYQEEKAEPLTPIQLSQNKQQIQERQNQQIQNHSMEVQKQSKEQSQEKPIQEKEEKRCTNASIQNLIRFLISNIKKDQCILKKQSLQIIQEYQIYPDIITGLIKKFKKAKKTKEEMVKYCMRKAFKFVADRMKKDRTHNRDIDSCMKMYFSKNQTQNGFSIPFKKNSTEKTMNGNFLKRVFSSPHFLQDYYQFLDYFQELVQQDNDKKVKYLADLIDQYIKSGEIKKIDSIKRLPWTQDTLDHTIHLSRTLVQYADKEIVEPNFKKKEQ